MALGHQCSSTIMKNACCYVQNYVCTHFHLKKHFIEKQNFKNIRTRYVVSNK